MSAREANEASFQKPNVIIWNAIFYLCICFEKIINTHVLNILLDPMEFSSSFIYSKAYISHLRLVPHMTCKCTQEALATNPTAQSISQEL